MIHGRLLWLAPTVLIAFVFLVPPQLHAKETELHKAIKEGDLDLVARLIDQGADVDEPGRLAGLRGGSSITPLQVAAQYNQPQIAQVLLDAGADIDKRTRYRANTGGSWVVAALHFAVINDHVGMVSFLLDAGAGTETGGCWDSALGAAAREGNLEMVELLLANEANINGRYWMARRPLDVAEKNGHTAIARVLKQLGAERKSEIQGPESPLHTAAKKGELLEVQRLIADGAPVNARDTDERTPLYRASQAGHIAIVEELVEAGADPDLNEVETCRTPLHAAVRQNHTEVAQRLLAAGAEVNAQGSHGWTPLHVAIHFAERPIVDLLLEHGADLQILTLDEKPRTPVDMTAEKFIRHRYGRKKNIHFGYLQERTSTEGGSQGEGPVE